jgi:hypothetical protein
MFVEPLSAELETPQKSNIIRAMYRVNFGHFLYPISTDSREIA